MAEEHNVTLLAGDMHEIERIVNEDIIKTIYHHFWDEQPNSSSLRKANYKSMKQYAKDLYDTLTPTK